MQYISNRTPTVPTILSHFVVVIFALKKKKRTMNGHNTTYRLYRRTVAINEMYMNIKWKIIVHSDLAMYAIAAVCPNGILSHVSI